MENRTLTSSRKKEHLIICSDEPVERGTSGFEDVQLVHNALPECDMSAIDTSISFLGHKFSRPLFIAAMTGGHPDTHDVNLRLARAAGHFGLGLGVGSQRAALENPEFEQSFTVVREEAPDAFLCGNLGIIQLRDHGLEWADRAVEMIDADALCIHLNPLQEAIQPEGDHDSSNCFSVLQELCSEAKYPIIVKETGCGISAETAQKLWAAGVGAIDIGGYGGTSWAAVECVRAQNTKLADLGEQFSDWGIPTAVSLYETAMGGGQVIATGGLRSGIDIAKSIALGATLGGMALPLLKPAMESEDALFETINGILKQLIVAMYLTGSRNTDDLRRLRTYITGKTREMIILKEE